MPPICPSATPVFTSIVGLCLCWWLHSTLSFPLVVGAISMGWFRIAWQTKKPTNSSPCRPNCHGEASSGGTVMRRWRSTQSSGYLTLSSLEIMLWVPPFLAGHRASCLPHLFIDSYWLTSTCILCTLLTIIMGWVASEQGTTMSINCQLCQWPWK